MALTLYDLCTADQNIRLSPPCWLVKFALLHKGVAFKTVPVGFSDKSAYPDTDYGRVPQLDDDGVIVKDSPVIIAHLEKKFPEPALLRSPGEKAALDFIGAFLGAHLFPALAPLLFKRIHAQLGDADQAYFRETREARFGGRTLEELAADPGLPGKVEAALGVLDAPLRQNRFFGGDQPNLSDYQVASVFMWARSSTSENLWASPDAFTAWFDRILDLFDGYGRQAARPA